MADGVAGREGQIREGVVRGGSAVVYGRPVGVDIDVLAEGVCGDAGEGGGVGEEVVVGGLGGEGGEDKGDEGCGQPR